MGFSGCAENAKISTHHTHNKERIEKYSCEFFSGCDQNSEFSNSGKEEGGNICLFIQVGEPQISLSLSLFVLCS
jgi:hypothetical protein